MNSLTLKEQNIEEENSKEQNVVLIVCSVMKFQAVFKIVPKQL